jgi:non-specific serine/threonine protein kinase
VPEQLDEFEAVRLFAERASAALPGFAITAHNASAVLEICRQLDGIPLALELAASRVKAMAVDHIASRLGDRMRLLTGGSRTAPPRQQTLRATIDWSHELLSPEEQILFRRLSVFAGGWTPDAAEAVCAGNGLEPGQVLDLLTRLVDKSLVMTATHPDGPGEGRYWPLETIREYAGVRLRESGEEPAVRRVHRDYFVALAQRSEPSLRGPNQAASYARLNAEKDNFRAALAWCGQDPESHEAGLGLAGSLWWFWFTQGALSEARGWLGDALARDGPKTPPRASALYGMGAVAWNQGDLALAARCAGEALVLCREFGDRLGVIYCLSILGAVSMLRGQHEQAAAMLEEALGLCRASGHRWETAMVLGLLGWAADQRGDPNDAVGLCRESLTLFRAEGDRWGQGTVLAPLGRALRHRGEHAQAQALLEESVALTRELGSRRQLALSLHELALVRLATGETGRAAPLEREALMLSREDEAQWGIAESLEGSAALAVVSGQTERAARLLGAASARREAISAPRPVPEDAAHALTTAALERALGKERFDVAWHQGRTMSRTQAIEDALAVFAQAAETEPPGANGDQ